MLPWLIEDLAQRPETWTHPLVRAHYPAPLGGRLLRLWRRRDALRAAADALPPTVVHSDPQPRNLFGVDGPAGEETVAIDWDSIRLGALGHDPGLFLAAALLWGERDLDAARSLEAIVYDAYLAALREVGWRGDPDGVRLGYAVGASTFVGVWATIGPAAALSRSMQNTPLREGLEHLDGRPFEALIHAWATTSRVLLDLADEAIDRLDSIEGGGSP